jgi:3-oxoacyl-[acyl-carrier-protein] synthase II
VRYKGDVPAEDPSRRRAVITGIGVLSGDVVGADAYWARLLDTDQTTTPRALTAFEPREWLDRRATRHTERFAQVAAAAARLAAEDADLASVDPDRTGVVMGVGGGAGSAQLRAFRDFEREGPVGVSPLLGVVSMPNAPASIIALTQQARGPAYAISSGCASGTHAVGDALRLIQLGTCDVVYAGGTEIFYEAPGVEALSEALLAGLANMKVLSDDEQAHPFDSERDGFVPADGAAVLVVESLAHAHARGAHVYAELRGAANTNEAHDLIAPLPDGSGIARCLRLAIRDAGGEPADVRHVNVHGTGTQANDRAEAAAIRAVFGDPGPAVTSTKAATGHAGAAAGALEAAAVALSAHHLVAPPTAGLRRVDPELGIDIVQGAPRPLTPGLFLSSSLGLGGHNGCVVMASD